MKWLWDFLFGKELNQELSKQEQPAKLLSDNFKASYESGYYDDECEEEEEFVDMEIDAGIDDKDILFLRVYDDDCDHTIPMSKEYARKFANRLIKLCDIVTEIPLKNITDLPIRPSSDDESI